MKIIIISGPSGSGKTTLSKILLKKLKNGIILNTDNYYKTGIISLILSKIIPSFFDRKISFNKKLFNEDLDYILKNRLSKASYNYNFKTKLISKYFKKTKNIKVIILEGIFIREILDSLPSNNCIFINLKTNKNSCMRRIIKRDYNERGKSRNLAKSNFIKAWELFYKNKKEINSRHFLKKFDLRKKSKIKILVKKIIKIVG